MPADLFAPEMRSPVAPIGRNEPRLWVRRLAIFRDAKTIIRDVPLRPGLNIIWTPDMSSSGNRALAHGSGKTTFCRLLRACLGEPGYATDVQRSHIIARLPNGLIAAEIVVDGVCWVTVRPLGLPGGEFVAQIASIEEAIARGRRDGDPAFIDPLLAETFFPMMDGATPSDVSREQVWDVLRAWLTRDQECRLADLLAWRSTQTHSRSRAQVLSETAKLTMVRLALRAFDAEEQSAAQLERQLMDAADDERRNQAYKQQRYLDGLKSARAALGVSDEIGFDDTLDHKGLISLAETALAEAMRVDFPKPPEVGSIFARLNALNDERRALEAKHQESAKEAELKRGEAERYRAEANVGEMDITHGGVRVCPVCRVNVDETLAKGCGISLERCDLGALRASITDKRATATRLDGEATGATQEANRLEALINQLAPRQQEL